MIGATTSGRPVYPADMLDALFQAVDTDDVVDPVVSLPDPIPVDCSREDMRRCLDLCLQFWEEGTVRADLVDLVGRLLLTGDMPNDARIRFKHIRARYKQLRFALVLYGARHKAPFLFRSTVALMGQLQDAFRNGRRPAICGYALLLRLLLSRPAWLAVRYELRAVRIDDSEGFAAFRKAEFDRLKQGLQSGTLTGHQFHAMRKIISRQVSFYDTMRTLQPEDRLYKMSRFLSAINGLMGSMHDELVEQSTTGYRDYHRDDLPLPADIRKRLAALTEAYPL